MSEFISAGGFGMFPTLLFGFLLVVSSIVFLFRPEPRYLAAIVGLGVTTGAAGLLGFCTGVMNTLRYAVTIPAEEQLKVVMMGCKESLHGVVLGLVLLVVAGLFASIGAVRAMGLARSTPA